MWVVSGTVDTPERPDEALTGPSKTGPVCCGTSTARRPHGRPCAGHRGGGHQTCATRGSGWGAGARGRGVRCGARLLEPSPRLHDRRHPTSSNGTRSTHHLPTRAGERCVPCQILLLLANTRQGKPGGRAAALCRGAAAARGVSGKSVQATATEHPSGAVPGAE